MKINFKSKGFIALISLFFAIIFWAFVMADSRTTRIEDVRNVPINVVGSDTMTQRGLVITGQSKDTGNMRIEGGVNVVGYVNANNVNAYIDLRNIAEPGEYELPVNTYINNGSVGIKGFSPAKIKVTVERYVEKQVPIEINYDKEIPGNYWIDEATVQNTRVTVSGGQSVVDKVAKGSITVNTDILLQAYENNPNNKYEASLPVNFVDQSDNRVDGISSKSSIVSINVLSRKTVPIDVQGAITGNPADGYSINNIEQSISEIDIVGVKDVLNNINSMVVMPIDINGITANTTVDTTIKPVESVAVVGSDNIKVTINVKKGTDG